MPIVQVASSFGFRPLSSNSCVVDGPALRITTSPVRRRLFAQEDNDASVQSVEVEHRLMLERQLALIQREQSIKYNFDFQAEVPLPGRYVWERPSHPLPPPVAIKRGLDNTDVHHSSSPPASKQARITSQTKITGIGELLLIYCVTPSGSLLLLLLSKCL